MATWTCPECDRTFGTEGQGHTCRPGTTVAELAEQSLVGFRPIFDRIDAHLRPLGEDLIVDPIDAGVLFKHGPTFAMLRPMTKWHRLSIVLRRRLDTARLATKIQPDGNGKFGHQFNLVDADDVDDELCDWLTEAFYAAAGQAPPGTDADDLDGMVPDDVDLDIV